jgi:hypothetical protein
MNIRFRLLGTEKIDGITKVRWIVGVTEGVKSSTGFGLCEMEQRLSGLSEDQILEATLNAQGGQELVDDLFNWHSQNLKRNVCFEVIDDWYIAYKFYCSKVGLPPFSKAQCTEWFRDGVADFKLDYSHSVFNITENREWSNTFDYYEEGVGLRHIKVHDGGVTDWYTHREGLTYNNIPVSWTADDLVTGQVIEYYTDEFHEDGSVTASKYSAETGELLTKVTHKHDNPLPSTVLSRVDSHPYVDHIFGYGEKPYGDIVEYNRRDLPPAVETT